MSQGVVARFLVAASRPDKGGAHLLRCLAAMGPALHAGVAPMWDSALPRLVDYLEDKSKFNLETWEVRIRKEGRKKKCKRE